MFKPEYYVLQFIKNKFIDENIDELLKLNKLKISEKEHNIIM